MYEPYFHLTFMCTPIRTCTYCCLALSYLSDLLVYLYTVYVCIWLRIWAFVVIYCVLFVCIKNTIVTFILKLLYDGYYGSVISVKSWLWFNCMNFAVGMRFMIEYVCDYWFYLGNVNSEIYNRSLVAFGRI